MVVASPVSPLTQLFRFACAWSLMLAIAACGGNSNPPADCALEGTCDPSDGTPDGGTPDGGAGGQWSPADPQVFLDSYNLLPRGTFVFQPVGSTSAQLVAKNADDSLVTAEIDEDPASENKGNASDWLIWHGEMYYKVEYAEIGAGSAKHWGFITGSLKTPGGSVAAPKTLALNKPYGGATTASVSEMSPLFSAAFNYTAFVNATDNENAVFEKTEEVAGISTKKYVASTSFSKSEWWILENGFCLKYHFSIGGEVKAGFETIQAELDTPTYDYVTGKYARFANQVGEAPPVDSMLKIVDAVSADVWTAPSEFVPWTAGSIDLMMVIRAVNMNENPVFEVFFSFPQGTNLVAATEDYKNRILQVPGMVAQPPIGSDEIGYIWEYNNRDAATCDNGGGYYNYQVSSFGADGPSMPAQVVITYTRLICV